VTINDVESILVTSHEAQFRGTLITQVSDISLVILRECDVNFDSIFKTKCLDFIIQIPFWYDNAPASRLDGDVCSPVFYHPRFQWLLRFGLGGYAPIFCRLWLSRFPSHCITILDFVYEHSLHLKQPISGRVQMDHASSFL